MKPLAVKVELTQVSLRSVSSKVVHGDPYVFVSLAAPLGAFRDLEILGMLLVGHNLEMVLGSPQRTYGVEAEKALERPG